MTGPAVNFGLLCSRCNTGIGYLGDSPRIIRAAADYLVRHGKPEPRQ